MKIIIPTILIVCSLLVAGTAVDVLFDNGMLIKEAQNRGQVYI